MHGLNFNMFSILLQLADAMRKAPYQTNILLGGFDQGAGASLYFMDMYSALTKVNFGVHGHASNFLLSIFDREWKVTTLPVPFKLFVDADVAPTLRLRRA
jgi:20S proteasome alpha/beta subunit